MYSPAVSSVPRSLFTGFVNPSFQSKANFESYCFNTLTGSTTGAKGTGVDTMYFLRNCVEAEEHPRDARQLRRRVSSMPPTRRRYWASRR